MLDLNTIHTGNCYELLPKIPDNSIDCCVTSPPYFGLRNYGTDPTKWPKCSYKIFGFEVNIPAMTCSYGLEPTMEAFVAHTVLIFEQVRRVLKPTGTLWLNFGDSYAGNGGQFEKTSSTTLQGKQPGREAYGMKKRYNKKDKILKSKDLMGIPWMIAFALREAGWYLRQDIIWHKPNPMPESVTDRCTKSHEYIFLLTKSAKYYYDHKSIMKGISQSSIDRLSQDVENQKGSDRVPGKTNGSMKAVKSNWNGSTFDKGKTGEVMDEYRHGARRSGNKERKPGSERGCPDNTGSNVCSSVPWEEVKANKRSVWTVTTTPFKEAHFATFPEELIVDCIKAGCPINGIVLDPFSGAGTTAIVSRKLERNFIAMELNEKYTQLSNNRINQELGMFK